MRQHKRAWRRITSKPVRRVRRLVRRKGGKVGGKARFFMATDEMQAYLRKKGRQGKGGKHYKSSGFGFERKRNPIGKDGKVMKCNKCGSEQHFERECTMGKGGGYLWVKCCS